MSTITLTVNAETPEELRNLLEDLSKSKAPIIDAPATERLEKEIVAKATKETLKPAKAKKVVEKPEPVKEKAVKEEPEKEEPIKDEPEKEEPKDEKVTEPKAEVTKADVQAAMKDAFSKGKKDAVKSAMEHFEAVKLSDLKPEDYSDFLLDLKEIVGE